MNDADWIRRRELTSLLQACRARRTYAGRGLRKGVTQREAASLAGLSLRKYAAIERAEGIQPDAQLVDRVAAALRMTDAERSAAHILATGQDPPRPSGRTESGPRRKPGEGLRAIVTQLDPFPAAVTDEMWTLLHWNTAMSAWTGGWYDARPPAERNMILHLYSKGAKDLLPDVEEVRRVSVAALRYQFTRNYASPRIGDLVDRLLADPKAREQWNKHEVVIPRHSYSLRIRHEGGGITESRVTFMPEHPQLWLYCIVIPDGLNPPYPSSRPAV